MAREPRSIPDTAIIRWEPTRCAVPQDDIVLGPMWRLFATDPETGAMTYMTVLPPGWRDPQLDWHPVTEESFRLSGGQPTTGANPMGGGAGRYLYRHPGVLHGPAFGARYEATMTVQRMGGPRRILRYNGTKFPHEHGQHITNQHENWPIDEVFVETGTLPWEDAPSGGWSGARFKWLHRNKVNGGGAVLFELPAGWEGKGAAARGPIEEFVVEGSVTSDGEHYLKWGYVSRAAGDPAGSYSTEEGAQLLCWWDEGSELE